MKLFALAAILCLATPAFSHDSTYTLVINDDFDNESTPSSKFKCARGDRGLISHHYDEVCDVPGFPFVAGIPHVEKNPGKYCLTCWELQYKGAVINVTAIEGSPYQSKEMISVSSKAFSSLTGNEEEGAQVTATRNPACDPAL